LPMLPQVPAPRGSPRRRVQELYGSTVHVHGAATSLSHKPRRAPITETWWDEPLQPSAAEEAAVAGLAAGTGTDGGPSPGVGGPMYVYQVEQPAMAYRASVLEERMLLAAVKRRRNELGSAAGSKPGELVSWAPHPPTQPRHRRPNGGGSARADFARGGLGASPAGGGSSSGSSHDPWAESLASRRGSEQGRVDYFLRGSHQLSEVQRPWLERRNNSSARVPRADELYRVHYFLTHARQHMSKPGGRKYFDEVTQAFKSQADRKRISRGWADSVKRSHRDLAFISVLREREAARQADRKQAEALEMLASMGGRAKMRETAAMDTLRRIGSSKRSGAPAPAPAAAEETASARKAAAEKAAAAEVEAVRKAAAEKALLTSQSLESGSGARAASPPAYSIVPL
jgi:hypothetical protein